MENFLRLLITACLPLMKKVLTLLVLPFIIIRINGNSSLRDVAFQKKIFGLDTTALIVSNK